VVLVAPFAEELFFRALIFRGTRGYWGVGPSLLMSGLAFGLFHLNPSVILPFAAIGVLFAWANEQSGSLWTSITAHAAFNTVSFALSLIVVET
jgi:membrane protease YdiL (CAAX protease family)